LSKSSSGFWRRTLSRVTPAAFVSLSLCIVGLSAQQKAPQAAAEKVTAQEAPAQKPAAKKPAAKKPAAKKPAAKKPAAKKPAPFDLSKLDLRCLGPARMGGRVIDLAVVESRPSTFYVATASGGLWKTVNGGTTFAPVFESERTVSLGDVEIAPSDPKILWVGTGEANNRNSTSWGNGVYKSVDAGKSWKHMGLPKSYHIGAIAIHPTNPDIVFVAACGDLWAPNPERGLYRTQDGGKSWELVLKRDEFTGATEVCIDPSNPDVIFAALYERQRDGFDTNDPKKRWGPGSGALQEHGWWRQLAQAQQWPPDRADGAHCARHLPQGSQGHLRADRDRVDRHTAGGRRGAGARKGAAGLHGDQCRGRQVRRNPGRRAEPGHRGGAGLQGRSTCGGPRRGDGWEEGRELRRADCRDSRQALGR
jgi:hypothetical protein